MTDDGRDFNPHADPDWTPLKPRPRKPERIGQPRASKPDDIQAALDRIIPAIKARDAKRFPREREQARRRTGQ